jgi:hypothetical protein
MELLLDYSKDRNNGISTISDVFSLKASIYGEPSVTDQFMIIPIQIAGTDSWQILSYKYDIDWISQMVFEAPSLSYFSMDTAINTESSPTMGILNNETEELHIYILNEFERWYQIQTIDIPSPVGPNLHSKKCSFDGNYAIISDYNYNGGAFHVYKWNGVTSEYEFLVTKAAPVLGTKFGFSVYMRGGIIFIGAPNVTTAMPNDGAVYIYTGADAAWILAKTYIGEPYMNGYFGRSISAYVDTVGSIYRLLVGAPGANNARGKAYFYHRIGGVWGVANTIVSAPPAYQADNNQFGSYVSIWADQACVASGNELLGQGAVYIYAFGGVTWAIDVLEGTALPARFTHSGLLGYGVFSCQTIQTVLTGIQSGDGYMLKRRPTGWTELTFIYHDNISIKKTVDESFFHLASGNQTIVFKLGSPIWGSYKIILNMENALQTIGPQNDHVYFSIDGVFYSVILDHGNYDGVSLGVHLRERLLPYLPDVFVRWESVAKKYTVITSFPFAWGSNLQSSFRDSAQNKILGFADNHYSVVHGIYASDRQVDFDPPTRIGVNIKEGYPLIPVRNNSIFAEVGVLANLNTISNRYEILDEDEQILVIPHKTNTLSFYFPAIAGGAFLDINTNDIKITLIPVD